MVIFCSVKSGYKITLKKDELDAITHPVNTVPGEGRTMVQKKWFDLKSDTKKKIQT